MRETTDILTFTPRLLARTTLQFTLSNLIRLVRILLSPVALLYGFFMQVRNFFYDNKIFNVHTINAKVISVGNISAGGTGKTPMVEHLLSLCHEKDKVAVISRGYGRKTDGLLELIPPFDPSVYGDEPCQIKQKFPRIKFFVAESRVEAAKQIMQLYPEINTIVLDDAFQHRSIARDVDLVLTPFHKLFTYDFMLPTGYLREFAGNVNRADAVIITKTPNPADIDSAIRNVRKHFVNKPIFISAYSTHVGQAVLGNDLYPDKPTLALSSIADYALFVKQVKAIFPLTLQFALKDHAIYTSDVLTKIKEYAIEHSCCQIVTTEKDWVKLNNPQILSQLKGFSIALLTIKVNLDSACEEYFKSILA